MDTSPRPITPDIEVPVSLLPDLEVYGIIAIDQGICEDSYTNRSILRANNLKWHDVYDEEGKPTDRIMVISPAMQENYLLSRKADLLENLSSPNSDYRTGVDLLFVERVQDI